MRTFGALVAGALLTLVGCGREQIETTPVASLTTTADSPVSAVVSPAEAVAEAATLEQPAVWPAPDVVFATPEEAAADFVETVFDVPPTLGEFRAGDARSGEIEVLSPGDGDGATPSPRALLLLRQLGSASGWFVIGAVNEFTSIENPSAGATVDAASVTVEGVGRGFEGTVTVTGFVAGDAGSVLDLVITRGGPFADPEPYSVDLDLSDAPVGATVALVTRGDTGLETDPGEFSAIPVVIGGTLPGTR